VVPVAPVEPPGVVEERSIDADDLERVGEESLAGPHR
jgi:hypothetical protein